MKKITSIFIILFVFTSFNYTLIRQRTLPELIIQSHTILIGQIKTVTDTSLIFQNIEAIKGGFIPFVTIYKKQKGEYNTRKLHVNKTGQLELLFLSFDNETKTYELYTNHGEAEYLIKDSVVYIYGGSWYLKKNRERYPTAFVTVDDNSIDAAPYLKTEMCTAIKDYLQDSRSLAKKLYKEPDIKYIIEYKSPQKEDVIIKNKELNVFINRSRSHKRLIHELIDDPNNNIPMAIKRFEY